jgi:glycosyltransferase involved in cell wall biosynthesis
VFKENRIKILHIISGLYVGGAEKMLAKVSTSLQQRGFENVVVSLKDGGEYGSSMQENGVKLYEMNVKSLSAMIRSLYRLWKIVNDEKPSIIQGWMYHANALSSLIAPFTKCKKIVWNIRCSHMDTKAYKLSTGLSMKINKLLSGMPEALIVNSQDGMKYHQKIGYGAKMWKYIPNGYDTDDYNYVYGDGAGSILKRKGELLVGLVARLDPKKDHKTFLSAAKILKERNDKIRFVCVGTGPDTYKDELRKYSGSIGIDEEVEWIDRSNDIRRIYASCDFIVSSSAFGEGSSNVICEAMSCGLPCVVTDVGDSALLVGEGGIVVPPSNAGMLADGCQRVIDMDNEQRRSMGNVGRKRIIEHFSLNKVIDQYEHFYRSIIVN